VLGLSACQDCASGKYNNEAGSSADNKEAGSSAELACKDCASGKYSNEHVKEYKIRTVQVVSAAVGVRA